MLSSAIIVFREVLEIALILTVIMVATRQLRERNLLVLLGLAAGTIGSIIIAFFTDTISESFEGSGQEIFNAGILFFAVLVLGWTVVWMKKHGREIMQHAKHVGEKVMQGIMPLYSVSVVIALSTLREGAEIVLFSYGLLASGKETLLSVTMGGLIGFAGGTVIGTLFYFGMLRISPKHLFGVTSWLLTFLAAGMAAQGAGYLIAADVIPALIDPVWDTSWILPEENIVGKILHSLIGYTDRPSGSQLIFYVVTFIVIGTFLVYLEKKSARKKR